MELDLDLDLELDLDLDLELDLDSELNSVHPGILETVLRIKSRSQDQLALPHLEPSCRLPIRNVSAWSRS